MLGIGRRAARPIIFEDRETLPMRSNAARALPEYREASRSQDSRIDASQPIVAGLDRVFISTDAGADGAMLQIAAGANGQLTARELWRTNRMSNYFTSAVLHDGFIYGLDRSSLPASTHRRES